MEGRPAPSAQPAGGISAAEDPSATAKKRLVLFADGTGNAYSTQSSNVWRLYDALDKTVADSGSGLTQLPRYIPGVGTSAIGLIRRIDGATGFGVPSNVRKLYRFLCWNWAPGDEIWLFGFSRGAFTVRTLAAMVKYQGLMPQEIDGRRATTVEMRRNAKGAWRAYREATAPFQDPGSGKIRMSPAISLVRKIRNSLVNLKRRCLRQRLHDEVLATVRAEQPARCPGAVKIKFMGLFDTVEAYGVPLEDLRAAINWWIWPITFRNRVCSGIVEKVRHALSIDEERRTFQPVRFDQSPNKNDGPRPEIEEVWFAGVHSDIGGGYPDDDVAYEPLVWMLDEAQRNGIHFATSSFEMFRNRRFRDAPIHDSRKGLQAAYRYTPRMIDAGAEFGGPPKVHSSVLRKITNGADGYAPVSLRDGYVPCHTCADIDPSAPQAQIDMTFNGDAASRVGVLVLWRRIANISFISLLVLLLAFPWIIDPVRSFLSSRYDSNVYGVSRLPEVVTSIIPPGSGPWIRAYWAHFTYALLLFGLTFALYLANGKLGDMIKDRSIQIWRPQTDMASGTRTESVLQAIGAHIIKSGSLGLVYRISSKYVVPLFLAALALVFLLKVLHVAGLALLTSTGAICQPPQGNGRDIAPGQVITAQSEFSTQSDCWSSGIKVVEGRTYLIKFEETVTFTDDGAVVPLAGFRSNQLAFLFGKLIRRADADWFQPVAQIGYNGREVIPLAPVDGEGTTFLPKLAKTPAVPKSARSCGSYRVAKTTGRTFVTKFRAGATGPLYLFVNDAILWPAGRFYANNGGCAIISVFFASDAHSFPPAP